MLATDLAYYLVRKGVSPYLLLTDHNWPHVMVIQVSFRKAHELSGAVVAATERLGTELHSLPLAVYKEIS